MEDSARPASAAVRFPAFAFAHVSRVVLCSGGDDDGGDDDDGDDDGGGCFAGEPCQLSVSVFSPDKYKGCKRCKSPGNRRPSKVPKMQRSKIVTRRSTCEHTWFYGVEERGKHSDC